MMRSVVMRPVLFNQRAKTRPRSARVVLALLLVGWLVAPEVLRAQWSSDPATNLVLSDRSGEQVQPKVATIEDGGAYVSWFDNADGGYDVYLQRLDRSGIEQWPHNGILVLDRGFSSTQDYGLASTTPETRCSPSVTTPAVAPSRSPPRGSAPKVICCGDLPESS